MRDPANSPPSVEAPEWRLDSIYESFESEQYRNDLRLLEERVRNLKETLDGGDLKDDDFRTWLSLALSEINDTVVLASTLGNFSYSRFSVDTADPACTKEMNRLQAITVPLQSALAMFRSTLGRHPEIVARLSGEAAFAPYTFLLNEHLAYVAHQMSPGEETLASDLSRSGSEAFSRLQESLSSSLSKTWNESSGEKKTMVELRGLAHDADRAVRKKAHLLEIESWEENRIAFAAALNGVKGASLSIAKRRSWANMVDLSVLQSRISRKTLDTLIAAMHGALPDFRRYMKAKARLLGLDRLSFYDLFAPLPSTSRTWTFDAARQKIIEQFAAFSPRLSEFASMAFEKKWIDARPRPGKVGGAYCIDFPLRGEIRVMSNFTGNFESLITLAHELGHGWHSYLLGDLPGLLRDYPTTLAESASLFCETLVFEEEMKAARGNELLALREQRLSDLNQIITDILSRFIFESAVFERRADAELSPDELCDLMLDAQRQTYGDALNPDELHPYMWAVKSHYYIPNLNFYNYPYAFGQLFGLGLFAEYQRQGKGFPERYERMLRKTGGLGAVRLCAEEGINIESRDFWDSALSGVRRDIDEFCNEAGL